MVAAFHTVPSEALFRVYNAKRKARRPSLVYYGDDRASKRRRHAWSVTWALIRWTLALCAWPDLPSGSRSSSVRSPLREKEAPSWCTASSGLDSRHHARRESR